MMSPVVIGMWYGLLTIRIFAFGAAVVTFLRTPVRASASYTAASSSARVSSARSVMPAAASACAPPS
jgi:hypothetical protein